MNISMSQNKNYDFGQIMSLYLEMKVSVQLATILIIGYFSTFRINKIFWIFDLDLDRLWVKTIHNSNQHTRAILLNVKQLCPHIILCLNIMSVL